MRSFKSSVPFAKQDLNRIAAVLAGHQILFAVAVDIRNLKTERTAASGVADLRDAQVPAQEAITSLVLDAPLSPEDKIAVAEALGSDLTDQQGQVPDLRHAFATLDLDPSARVAAAQLERDLNAQVERAATLAFRDSFLIGAGLALIAMLTVIRPRRRRTP